MLKKTWVVILLFFVVLVFIAAIAESAAPSLRKQLEASSPKTTEPIFEEGKRFPLKFFSAEMMGRHAVYIKTQQPDQGSINFYILGFDRKNGVWDQFGTYSGNYIFENMGSQTPKDALAIKEKIEAGKNEYFTKKMAEDFLDALRNQDNDYIKNAISKNINFNDITRIVTEHPKLANNRGYSFTDFKKESSAFSIVAHIIPAGGDDNIDAKMVFVKENKILKLLKISF